MMDDTTLRDVVAQLERMPSDYWPVAEEAIRLLTYRSTTLSSETRNLSRENVDLRASLLVLTRELYAARNGRDLKADQALKVALEDAHKEIAVLHSERAELRGERAQLRALVRRLTERIAQKVDA